MKYNDNVASGPLEEALAATLPTGFIRNTRGGHWGARSGCDLSAKSGGMTCDLVADLAAGKSSSYSATHDYLADALLEYWVHSSEPITRPPRTGISQNSHLGLTPSADVRRCCLCLPLLRSPEGYGGEVGKGSVGETVSGDGDEVEIEQDEGVDDEGRGKRKHREWRRRTKAACEIRGKSDG
ncbi:hypothetical protein B0H13DRAFT_1868756 [Mycena leptocephala]|nr:hypothetical protein B0H13DRAFT_1868756 [Mycena leptocephala]